MSDPMAQSTQQVSRPTLDLSRPIDLVIFDCDGVLIDSEIISARVLLKALAELGVEVDYSYFKRNFLGRSFPKVLDAVQRDFGLKVPEGFEQLYRTKLLATFDRELQPVTGIESILEKLSVPKCVATSSTPMRAAHSLTITGLRHHFPDRIFTASEVVNGKPAPDLFLHAARRCGISPENCLVIEDSIPGLTAAQAAEMQVLHFIGGSHLDETDALAADLKHPVPFFDTWTKFFDMAPVLENKNTPD